MRRVKRSASEKLKDPGKLSRQSAKVIGKATGEELESVQLVGHGGQALEMMPQAWSHLCLRSVPIPKPLFVWRSGWRGVSLSSDISR